MSLPPGIATRQHIAEAMRRILGDHPPTREAMAEALIAVIAVHAECVGDPYRCETVYAATVPLGINDDTLHAMYRALLDQPEQEQP